MCHTTRHVNLYPSISGQLPPKLYITEQLMISVKDCRPETSADIRKKDMTVLNMAKMLNLKCIETKDTAIISNLVMV